MIKERPYDIMRWQGRFRIFNKDGKQVDSFLTYDEAIAAVRRLERGQT